MAGNDNTRNKFLSHEAFAMNSVKLDNENDELSHEFSDFESALLDNLRYLNFDEKKVDLTLTAGLFSRSNPSAGDKIIHFLFSKIRPKHYEKDFYGVWPAVGKSETSQFRKIAHNLIYELENNGSLPKSNSSRSTLATCQGDRFVRLLWHLSALALRLVYNSISKEDVANMHEILKSKPSFEDTFSAQLKAITELRTRFESSRSDETRKEENWQKISTDMVNEYYDLKTRLELYDQQINHLQVFSNPNMRKKLESNMKGIQLEWEDLVKFSEMVNRLSSEAVHNVIQNKPHRFAIDGESIRSAMKQSEESKNESVVGWNTMFDRIRTKSDGQFTQSKSIQSPRNRFKPVEALELSSVLSKVTVAAEQVTKPLSAFADKAESSSSHYLSSKSENVSEMLSKKLEEQKLHLEEANRLWQRLCEELKMVESSISDVSNKIQSEESFVDVDEKAATDFWWSTSEEKNDDLSAVTLPLVPSRPRVWLPEISESSSGRGGLNLGGQGSGFVDLGGLTALFGKKMSLSDVFENQGIILDKRKELIDLAMNEHPWSNEAETKIDDESPQSPSPSLEELDPKTPETAISSHETRPRRATYRMDDSVERMNNLPLMRAVADDPASSPLLLGSTMNTGTELAKFYSRE